MRDYAKYSARIEKKVIKIEMNKRVEGERKSEKRSTTGRDMVQNGGDRRALRSAAMHFSTTCNMNTWREKYEHESTIFI